MTVKSQTVAHDDALDERGSDVHILGILHLPYPIEAKSGYSSVESTVMGAPPWSPPTASLWAVLSWYAPEVRRNKAVAFLRAFTDDSASEIGDRRLFFAGFVRRADEWALFAETWDNELKASPAIAYLKTSEAQNLKGQFRGWTREACEAKLLRLAHIIHSSRPFSF